MICCIVAIVMNIIYVYMYYRGRERGIASLLVQLTMNTYIIITT